ncbi:MAG TPA: Gfo/Idh/MocA family oxidoreductase [Campylobacterales bacterium]|nr:Gfo/Idh/MocA family oxidoreductase [Campylobacterales bacterium]HHH51262.1 Gfo/Idh/MocA family oxidoreductase [Campylobacterales bacterium]
MSKGYLDSKSSKIRKVLKYTYMYGASRTLIKVKGHYHMQKEYDEKPEKVLKSRDKKVGIIGCGNHAFTDIAYFLRKNSGNIIGSSMDIDINKAISLAKEYKAYCSTTDIEDILDDENINLVYIVSNHATHTDYAIQVLKCKKDVFVEKPISINMEQYSNLLKVVRTSDNRIYAGYNRPFSPAIETIKPYITNNSISLNCFIMGHKLASDHWYRKSTEGSRVVSNLGHWIDLSTHLVMARDTLPTRFELTLISANSKHKDDDFVLTIKTDLDDLIVLTFSTRSDPFEGVMENISFQNENIIAHIADFRKITIWDDNKKIVKRFIPKDAGHEKSVLQPFDEKKRNWKEVEWSTFIMLKVEEMLQGNIKDTAFDIETEIEKLIK